MNEVTIKLTSCKKCEHCDKSRYYTPDSWEFVEAWNCKHPEITAKYKKNKESSGAPGRFRYPPGIGFEEGLREPKRIPDWCPLLKE